MTNAKRKTPAMKKIHKYNREIKKLEMPPPTFRERVLMWWYLNAARIGISVYVLGHGVRFTPIYWKLKPTNLFLGWGFLCFEVW